MQAYASVCTRRRPRSGAMAPYRTRARRAILTGEMAPPNGQGKALVVEDDANLAELVSYHLRDLGYSVEQARDGEHALQATRRTDYALIVLDIMLPERDGFEVCKAVRQNNPRVPILMLTAKNEELDRVLGLELGADDYITKPFSIREFTARVRALNRRIHADTAETEADATRTPIDYPSLRIDPGKRAVTVDGTAVTLTAKEFDLLHHFARHPGQAFSRVQLLEAVWGYHYEGYEHTVNSHINRLRAKVEKDPSQPKYIRTVWGVGYRFADEGELTE